MSPKTPLLVLVLLFASFSLSLSRNYQKYSLSPHQTSYDLHGQYYHYKSLNGRLSSRTSSPSSSPQVFNVDDFGARADGTDDSQAFSKAWKRACSSNKEGVVLVPKNKVYHLKPIKFSGPCKSYVTLRISGVIKASPRRSDYEKDRRHWIQFEEVNNLRVEGGGTINGNGRKWWQNSCKINPALPCKHAPTAVTFDGCNNLVVANLSIGSLGAGNSEAVVSNVMVNRAKFSGTTNGVRIKTWQGGSGYAKNIVFQNISMRNVSNPIIIDQNYCDQNGPCHEQASAVQISNVIYSNIKGTSDSKVAVKFDCSKSFPCKGISLRNVDFVSEGDGESVEASCENVWLNRIGRVSPRCT
ncbi:hypothetical protein TIFTF001_022752 [Ficus carica]|uniref:Polygalacturonase n=1 Tax=Ficus carica TaxID=3494 RepID=A0AA88DK20_FICCA|nr:hypothetical protein TIFTF001_022752 [Ficus carica]